MRVLPNIGLGLWQAFMLGLGNLLQDAAWAGPVLTIGAIAGFAVWGYFVWPKDWGIDRNTVYGYGAIALALVLAGAAIVLAWSGGTSQLTEPSTFVRIRYQVVGNPVELDDGSLLTNVYFENTGGTIARDVRTAFDFRLAQEADSTAEQTQIVDEMFENLAFSEGKRDLVPGDRVFNTFRTPLTEADLEQFKTFDKWIYLIAKVEWRDTSGNFRSEKCAVRSGPTTTLGNCATHNTDGRPQ